MNTKTKPAEARSLFTLRFADFFTADQSTSCLLLLLTLGLSFLKPGPTTALLPLLSASSLLFCWTYKKMGVAISICATLLLFFFTLGKVEKSELLWQLGLHLSLTMVYGITFLVAAEGEKKSAEEQVLREKERAEWRALNQALSSSNEHLEQERERLEAEIENWKRESEQRRIEKQMEEKRLSLLQGDLEFYLDQKAALIAEAIDNQRLTHEAVALKREVDISLQREKLDAQKVEELVSRVSVLERERGELKGLVEGLEVEKEAFKNLLEQLRLEQEKIPVVKGCALPEETLELEKKVAAAWGQYNQLKMQFEEKSKVLSQTRKELFQAQGKLLAFEHTSQLEQIDYDLSEVRGLQQDLNLVTQDQERLREEVIQLEELVSRILAE